MTSIYNAQRTIPGLTSRDFDISIEDAYRISLHTINRRINESGEIMVGKKIGVTSAPVQEMLGVFQPDFGFLTDKMAYENGANIKINGAMIQPRAEAEIAFVLKSDLVGPNISEQDVLAATECIIPCFEIVDSRIENWKIKIEDTVADNASCGVYVLGDERVDPNGIDLAALKITVNKNGKFLSEGVGSAVQGNPLTAVAWLANTLGAYDIPFNAGDVILSGSLVPLEPVVAGDAFSLELEGVGSANVTFS